MKSHRLRSQFLLPFFALTACALCVAQSHGTATRENAGADYSGMYSFLREGEFVQLNIEKKGRVTGFVSRYGDTENDRGVFLDQFITEGKLESDELAFTTDTVHGVAFEFKGRVERGEGKNPGDEAYYVLKGTLTENAMDEGKKTSSHSRQVLLKIFPQDLRSDPGAKN